VDAETIWNRPGTPSSRASPDSMAEPGTPSPIAAPMTPSMLYTLGRPTSGDRIASFPDGVSTWNARPSSVDWIETARMSAAFWMP
jgi:hypothetical protein